MGKDTHIPTIELTSFSDKEYVLPKSMLGDRRYPNEDNDKFIQLNKQAFEFLNIDAYGESGKIHFKTNELVGAIPIRMPNGGAGTPQTDLIVKPRYQSTFSSNWYEWMLGLAEFSKYTLMPERDELLPLTRIEGSPAPKYLLAKEIILKFLPVLKARVWRKFDSLQKVVDRPIGNVNWNKYAVNAVDPQKRLLFDTSINSISENNSEFRDGLAYLNAAISEVHSFKTPLSVRIPLQPTIDQIHNRVLFNGIKSSQSLCNKPFSVLLQEPKQLRELKRAINNYIWNESQQSFAWRIDFSKLYESYVQRIVQLGLGSVKNNDRIPRLGVPEYGKTITKLFPQYLEPDIIAEFGGHNIIIDAKYKSYFFRRQSETRESQKERMRTDIHQIIAYTSILKSKIAILVAPVMESDIQFELVQYSDIYVGVVGLPIQRERAGEYARRIRDFVEDIIVKIGI